MGKAIDKQIDCKYGFPLFIQENDTRFLVSAKKLYVSDIWGLWHYIIKNYKRKDSKTDYYFLLSLVEQSQYFYETANNAPLKSQPLLYYYSFLNIAKVFITLKDPSLKRAQRKSKKNNNGNNSALPVEYNHGIEIGKIDKQTRLSNATINLKCLMDKNGNMQNISIAYHLSKHLGDNISHVFPISQGVEPTPMSINIKSMFLSCVGIHRTVSELYNQKEHFIKIKAPELKKKGRDLNFRAKLSLNISECSDLSTSGYNINFDNIPRRIKDPNNLNPFVNFEFKASSSKLVRKDYVNHAIMIRSSGIWHYNAGDDNRMYISHMAFSKKNGESVYTLNPKTQGVDSINLSSGTIIYFIMFFLGSITRYHPYMFESILSDKDIWMIGEFLKTQPYQFMNILLSNLLSTPVYPTRMVQ